MDPSTESVEVAPRDDGTQGTGGHAIRFSRRKLLRGLAILIGIILLAHLSVHTYHYRVAKVPDLLFDAVDVDQEDTFSTWYQSSTILLAGFLALIIAARRRAIGDSLAMHWRVLGIVFVWMSADEIAGFHETLNSVVSESWTVPAAIVAALFSLAYLPFLLRIPRATARRFVFAGAAYLGGAVGVERFSEWFIKVSFVKFDLLGRTLEIRHTNQTIAHTLDYSVSTALEEGFEMLGIWLFIRALLYVMSNEDEIVIPVVADPSADHGAATHTR